MILLALLLQAQAPLPDRIPNGGFEASADLPVGWEAHLPRGYRVAVVTEQPFEGRRSVLLAYGARNAADRRDPASLSTTIDARRYRGRLIRVTAAVRLQAAGAGGLSIHVEGNRVSRTSRVGFSGHAWRRVGASVAVPRSARTIRIRFEVTPSNDLQVDDVRLEAVRP